MMKHKDQVLYFMAKYQNKTVVTQITPDKFISGVEPASRREDGATLLRWFEQITGLEAKMWGPSIVGFGRYHYKYDSGHEGEYFLTGFSPRKTALTLYIMPGYRFGDMPEKLKRLGKHKLGKSCLYINKLSDIDMDVLSEIVSDGVSYMRKNYDTWDV